MRFEIERLTGYQIMPTDYIKDKTLSLKAKGLLAVMYSLPNEWDYSVNGLCKITNTGITSIRTILAEIEEKGYLVRVQTRTKEGRFEYIYKIFANKRKRKDLRKREDILSLKRFAESLHRI